MKQPKKLGYLSIGEKEISNVLTEKLQGVVFDKQVNFPKELGVEHPFKFEDAEKVYKSFGIITGAINKIADNIVGEFSVKCKNPNARKLIVDFIKESNMQLEVKEWIIESLLKGNGFMELDVVDKKLNVLNANDMYVVRDRNGNVKGYNQFTGQFKNFSMDSRKLISFRSAQMCHLRINTIAGEAYGQGILMANERVVENLIQKEQDLAKLINRKANAPIHAKVGQPGEVADPTSIDNIKNNLVYMTNRTEWVTDANVEMKVLEFGDIGKNLIDAIMHDIRMLCAGMQIPEVMLNSGQLNEGIGNVQLEAFQRFIASIQEDIEFQIENKILKPYLLSNGFQDEIEFVWNLPGEEEINLRLTNLNTMLQNQYLSDGMRRSIQIEIGRLLNFENPELLVDTPNTQGMTADKNPVFQPDGKVFEPKGSESKEEKKENEREKEEKLPQPEVPGVKNEMMECACHEKAKITENDYSNMSLKEYVNMQEVGGFNYSDYLINILKRLKTDKFETLQAITESDIEKGLLNNEQVDKLRQILKDGFRKNQSIREIELEIKNNLNLKDRITENGQIISAEVRPNMISRTETLRLANIGLVDTYKQNGVERCTWLSSVSERTCDVCMNLNGRVMLLDEYLNLRSEIHPNCRCTALSIIE